MFYTIGVEWDHISGREHLDIERVVSEVETDLQHPELQAQKSFSRQPHAPNPKPPLAQWGYHWDWETPEAPRSGRRIRTGVTKFAGSGRAGKELRH